MELETENKFTRNNTQVVAITIALVLLMLATRMDHFGSAISLPDASLAVFFLAGFHLYRPSFFLSFVVLAAGIDYWAITARGVSDFCVTPAYGFLLPTYFVVWWSGCWAQWQCRVTSEAEAWVEQLRVVAAAWLALSAAFLISNGSFYLWSGYFADLTVAEYIQRVSRYYMPYVANALFYLVAAGMLHKVVVRLLARRSRSLSPGS